MKKKESAIELKNYFAKLIQSRHFRGGTLMADHVGTTKEGIKYKQIIKN